MLHSLLQALWTVVQVAAIIVPLTVVYQVLRDNRWVARTFGPHGRALRRLGFGDGAVVPLVAGVLLGIVYGAGILIQEARGGKMDRREVFLLGFFLCLCHAVVEDTLLFVVVGGDGWWILGPRVVLAVGATAVLARCLPRPRP
ncbi:MAG: nucleoside recognition domain-containing protein [Deferrisomatales bacterium]